MSWAYRYCRCGRLRRLSEYAFDCDELRKQLEKIELSEDVQADLESNDYLFGRGACDMKSGVAVFMVLAK